MHEKKKIIAKHNETIKRITEEIFGACLAQFKEGGSCTMYQYSEV
jgi:hypothetical protein